MHDKLEPGGNKPLTQAERDREDLQNEVAGRDVGRPKRFLSADVRKEQSARERQNERAYMSALRSLLMNDPEYAVLYDRVAEKIDKATTEARLALEANARVIERLDQELDELKARASTLPDGTRVFRDKDGNVITEDGRELDPDEAALVNWKEGAPSYEEYLAKKQAREKALEDREAIQRYQREVLDPARTRIEDEDNPISKDELEELDKGIEALRPAGAIESYLKPDGGQPEARKSQSTSASQEYLGEKAVTAPDVGESFKSASADVQEVPDLDLPPSPGPGIAGTKA
ncbi:hypothetical protein MJD09_03305 [bacterium]|nr:hypothetical protein [bacterium]